MMKLLLPLLFVLTVVPNSYSQSYYNQQERFLKANSIWAFGYHAGIDMNQHVAIKTSIIGQESCASVADSNGNLLFYIARDTIYNRNHQPMLNGSGIIPLPRTGSAGNSISQGVLIVPAIDTLWKYYVFRNQNDYNDSNRGHSLTYSVVDMTLDNGFGGVEAGRKNILLDTVHRLNEAMIAIPGENCDVWVLTHTLYFSDTTGCFKAWHITSTGIDGQPVYSLPTNIKLDFMGHLAVSPDRKNIAIASYAGQLQGALLAKFNVHTGLITSQKNLDMQKWGSYGVCFSPDNTKLYVQSYEVLKQFDITSDNEAVINNSARVVHTKRGSSIFDGPSLKLYHDTIYLINKNDVYTGNSIRGLISAYSRSISRINSPNLSGNACNVQEKVITLLSGTEGFFTLPNDVVFPVIKERIATFYDSICFIEDSGYQPKTLHVGAGYRTIEWDNGQTGNSREINHPGAYWVKYRTTSCDRYIDTFHVSAVNLNVTLGEDKSILFCNQQESPLTLSVNIPNALVKWQDGSEGGRYRVTQPGVYWAQVSKGGCTTSDTIKISDLREYFDLGPDHLFCKGDPILIPLPFPDTFPGNVFFNWSHNSLAASKSITDTGTYWVEIIQPPCVFADTLRVSIEVCTCQAHIPNAFSPNGDGLNDYFQTIIESLCPVSNYSMNIFNRFGERVFSSTQPDRGWDGQYRGLPAEIGTYFYEIRFIGGTGLQEHYYKGDLVLLR